MNRFFVILFIAFSMVSCKDKNQSESIKTKPIAFEQDGNLWLIDTVSKDTVQQLAIEISDDDYEVQTGLMYRESMEANQAMLFVFPEPGMHSFYMKNTLIPLDIIFIDENRQIVNIQKNAKPLDETSLPSEKPVQFVLEINAGLSDKWQLKPGDKVEWRTEF